MKTKSILIILMIIFVAGCSKIVCNVGNTRITSKDLSLREKVAEIYYPGSGKDYVALAQLIKGYLSEEVLKSVGHPVNDAVFDAEAARIDANTKAPDVLKKIKDVYGNDRKRYIKTFARIVYAERVLYNEVFLPLKEIHKEQFEKINRFLKDAVNNPDVFKEKAKKEGLDVRTLRVSLKQGIVPYNMNKANTKQMQARQGSGIEHAKRMIDMISGIKPGQVYPEVIEWAEGYQVIRYVRRSGGDYIIESAGVQKRDYDSWFWETASKVPVKIFDTKLKDELLKEVSWAKNLKLQ